MSDISAHERSTHTTRDERLPAQDRGWREQLRKSSEDSRQLFPVNHRLRPVARTVIGLVGLALAAGGVVGFLAASDLPFFGDRGEMVLGYSVNQSGALVWLGVGVILLLAALAGHNVVAWIASGLGALLILAGVGALATIDTDLNIFAYTITDVVVTFVVGLVVMMLGMYSFVLPQEDRERLRTRETVARDPHDSDFRRDPTLRRE